MNAGELDALGLAWFLAVEAMNVSIDGRQHRRDDFVRMFADRLYYANQTYARKLAGRHTTIAGGLVDTLIAEKALSTSVDEWEVTLHGFDTVRYRAVVKQLTASNPICQQATAAGGDFWGKIFADIPDA
jgi:hypothetical protein